MESIGEILPRLLAMRGIEGKPALLAVAENREQAEPETLITVPA